MSTAESAAAPAPAPVRVSRNAAFQMLGRLIYLLTRVALPPITLHYISLEEYGIWSTCFLIIGYVGIGTFGVSNVYVRFAAEYNATGRQREIGSLLAVGLTLTLSFSALVLAALWFCMPWVLAWFKIPPALEQTATLLILGSTATMLLDMTFGAYASILQGVGRIGQQTAVWILSFLLETAVMVTLLMQGFGVKGLLLAFAARYLFSTVVYAVQCYQAVPGLKLSLRGAGREKYRLFFGYGGVLQLTGLLGVFLYSCERLAAGSLTGVGAVGLLDIGQKFPVMASQLFGSGQTSFLTALTHLHAQNRRGEIVAIYARGTRYLNLLNALAMGFMAPFGLDIITAWMGHPELYQEAATVMVFAAVGYHLHALTGPATTYFQGIHRPWRPLLGFLVPQLALAAAGLLLAMEVLGPGLLAVVAAMAGARVLSSLQFLVQTNHTLGYSNWRFLWFVLLPGLVPYGIGYGLEHAVRPWLESLGTSRFQLLPALAALGAAYTVAVLLAYLVLSTPDERALVRRKLLRGR
jgi:O-antigen/teichoic acid export membrane protein